jgi:hypothetical protein
MRAHDSTSLWSTSVRWEGTCLEHPFCRVLSLLGGKAKLFAGLNVFVNQKQFFSIMLVMFDVIWRLTYYPPTKIQLLFYQLLVYFLFYSFLKCIFVLSMWEWPFSPRSEWWGGAHRLDEVRGTVCDLVARRSAWWTLCVSSFFFFFQDVPTLLGPFGP